VTTALIRTPVAPPVVHRAIWKKSDWTPHDIQRDIILSPVRNKVVSLGRRAGKSQIGGYTLIPEVFRAWSELDEMRARSIRREFWIVGPEYSDSEKEFRVLWNRVHELGFDVDRPGSYNNPEGGQMTLSMFGRRLIITAKSAKYPATLVGEGLSGVILAEAAKLKMSVWHKYLRPTLADFEGWSLFTSTPEGKNWFYDLYMIGLDGHRPDWASWRAPAWVNPYVYPGGVDTDLLDRAIEARRKHRLDDMLAFLRTLPNWEGHPPGINPEIWSMFLDQSQELFNQEVAALFTEYVGRVFKDFDEEIHVQRHPFRSGWATYAAADYGFTNPFVWLLLQVSPDRKHVHVLDEYYETHKDTDEAAREIEGRGLAPSSLRMFFPDPAEPDRSRSLSRLLKVRAYGKGSIPLNDRIEWIRRGLRIPRDKLLLPVDHPERKPSLTIDPKCVNTIREMNDYKYRETAEQAGERGRSAPEEPLDKDNHAPEALGRFYSGLFGSPYRDKAGATQTTAETRR